MNDYEKQMKTLRDKIEQSRRLNMGSSDDLRDVRDHYKQLQILMVPLGLEFDLFKREINSELNRIELVLRLMGE